MKGSLTEAFADLGRVAGESVVKVAGWIGAAAFAVFLFGILCMIGGLFYALGRIAWDVSPFLSVWVASIPITFVWAVWRSGGRIR